MSYPLLVVCEVPDDFALASRLIDRAIYEFGQDWVRDSLDAAREYFGIDPHCDPPEYPFVLWKRMGEVIDYLTAGSDGKARRVQLNIAQFGDGFPDHTEAKDFLRFVRTVQTSDRARQPDAFLLIRDADSHSKERTELRKLNALGEFKRFPAVVGVPDPEIECWLLAGFTHEASDAEETRISEMQRQNDGVHPCRDSHKLRAPNESDKRHPKQVLFQLTGGNEDRVRRCFDAPFALLRSLGKDNGLVAFLDALQLRLIPGLYGGPVSRLAG